jgi:dipeptidyl-peptidase-4
MNKKMIKRSLFISIALALSTQLFAQRIFNLEDIFTSSKMYPQALRQLQWIRGTHNYVYVIDNQLLKATAPDGEAKPFLHLDNVNNALKLIQEDTLKTFPHIACWLSDQTFCFHLKEKIILFDAQSLKAMPVADIPEDAQNREYNYLHSRMAYTVGADLYVCLFGQKPVKINDGTEKEIKYGHVVHRNEFGIQNGSFWSPKGNKLAFYRMDESMVANYPLVNTTSRMATLQNEKYPMAGETIHQVSLGVYDMNNGKTIYMQTGLPLDLYLCCVSWSPDEKYVFIALLNREQNHLILNQYDAENGKFVKTLLEERHVRYVEPSDPLYFLPSDSTKFIRTSRSNGWNHLYLYDINGKLIKPLTSGNGEVISFEGFDDKGEKVFFVSNKDEITGRKLFFTDIKTGKIQTVCQENGTHRVLPSSDGMYFLDRYSHLTLPACIKLKDKKANTLQTLLMDETALQEYDLPQANIGTLRNANGDMLFYRLIKPVHFDSTQKYPVFLYVYGGPHSQLVTNEWLSGGHFLHYMAQKGYVVFTLDNRGTAHRGFEFESVIHRQLGKLEIEDQMVGVQYLKSLPYVDTNRFSVDGWSYGGFMSISLKLQYPATFKIATAGGPVIDWKYYEAMYGERYMDMPQENPEGYAQNSLLNQVNNLDGHLLIIHGAMDPTVVWQNSLQFLTEAIKQRKQVDYFVYPTHEHNVRGIDRLHLWKKIEDYHAIFNKKIF